MDALMEQFADLSDELEEGAAEYEWEDEGGEYVCALDLLLESDEEEEQEEDEEISAPPVPDLPSVVSLSRLPRPVPSYPSLRALATSSPLPSIPSLSSSTSLLPRPVVKSRATTLVPPVKATSRPAGSEGGRAGVMRSTRPVAPVRGSWR